MTDIDADISVVQRLRNVAALTLEAIAAYSATDPADTLRRLCTDAADKIEGLRASLRDAQQHNMDLAEQLRAVNVAAVELPVSGHLPSFLDIKLAVKRGDTNVK